RLRTLLRRLLKEGVVQLDIPLVQRPWTLHDPQRNRLEHCARTVTCSELCENLGHVVFHRALGEKQRPRDLLVRIAPGHEAQDAHFALAEWRLWRRAIAIGDPLAARVRRYGREPVLATRGALDGISQIFGRCILEKERLSARL